MTPVLRLLFCGAAALFWELALIRWIGACVRIVAYFSNFTLIAAFFGLGAGALLAGRRQRLSRLIIPALTVAVLVPLAFAGSHHLNPITSDEYIWHGAPGGVLLQPAGWVSLWLVLPLVYLATALAFVVFGQWIGKLFGELPPLRAYSAEIAGSLLGILLFALLSRAQLGPLVWFGVGLALLLPILERSLWSYASTLVSVVLVVLAVLPFARQFIWSPYYRIHLEPLRTIFDRQLGRPVQLDQVMGHLVTVNSDYHQMMLDLRERPGEHAFFRSWRALYDAPYRHDERLPDGPILIVGAGTGNDTAAALRRTKRRVVAVEIDPAIARLGRELHPEHPFANPRVELIIDDARSYFQRSRERFALVVFGFLDSHTLLSSFSSVRLDNFVYTLESLQQVRRLLQPGGKVALTFAANTPWLQRRLAALLEQSFDRGARVMAEPLGYSNGLLFVSGGRQPASPVNKLLQLEVVPEDDWPFLYLRGPRIPHHYLPFLALILILATSSLLLLPRGERRLKLPYFFLGAAFFLLETSNIVSLSLLFGSTWTVNLLVFGGILGLVLLANVTCQLSRRRLILPAFLLLFASLVAAQLIRPAALLGVSSELLRSLAAVVVFLGPVYFAGILFATLIRDESSLAQAYGSNILGAIVGGACEYLSLLFGFRFLGALVFLFYALVFLLVGGVRGLRRG